MNTYIIINFTIIGFHNWPDAPDEYAYLRASHRHVFHYNVEVEVTHDNRQIEFIALKDRLIEWAHSSYDVSQYLDRALDFGARSCETLARELYNYMKYHIDTPLNVQSIQVLEDGENGAVVVK